MSKAFDLDDIFDEDEEEESSEPEPQPTPQKTAKPKPKAEEPKKAAAEKPWEPDFSKPWNIRFKEEMEHIGNDARLAYFAIGLATLLNDPSTGCARAYQEKKWTIRSVLDAFLAEFGKADFMKASAVAMGDPDKIIFGRLAHIIVDGKPEKKEAPKAETKPQAKPQAKSNPQPTKTKRYHQESFLDLSDIL